jgi:DNA mismatch repair ATPase MutL
LGFRGEALHSLGRVSHSLIIISTAQGEGKTTTKFDVKSQKQEVLEVTREHGTVVEIQ